MARRVRGDVVRLLRKRTGLTQQQFCQKCRVSDRTLLKAENNQEISETSALKIANGLNVQLDMLLQPPHLSPEAVIKDMIAHCMSEIQFLAHFINNVPDMEVILGREIDIPHSAVSITCFSELIHGPFERPAYNLPLVKVGYLIEPVER